MGSLVAFWERVAGRQKQKEQSREEQYREMVRDLAAFKEPDPDELDELLRAMERSVEDIKADVELLRKRQALWAAFKLREPSQRDKTLMQERISAAGVVLTKAKDEFKRVTDPLQQNIWALEHKIKAADEAEKELQETCPYPELKARLAELRGRYDEAAKAHSAYWNAARDAREGATRLRERAEFLATKTIGGDPKEPERVRKRAEGQEAKAAEYEALKAKHDAEMKEIKQEVREVLRLMLEP